MDGKSLKTDFFQVNSNNLLEKSFFKKRVKDTSSETIKSVED
ncbi:hypothetical protein [Bacillus sp. THAF10]|nr:hypothetical protein [Bacillus sp. THAF10]